MAEIVNPFQGLVLYCVDLAAAEYCSGKMSREEAINYGMELVDKYLQTEEFSKTVEEYYANFVDVKNIELKGNDDTMMIIKEPKRYNAEVVCQPYADGSGQIWGKMADYCGATLGIDESDICYREYRPFYSSHNIRDYGVICPCCNSFVQIDESSIPKRIKEIAISYEAMKGSN